MNKVRKIINYFFQYIQLRKAIGLNSYLKLPRIRYKSGYAKTNLGNIKYVDGSSFLSGLKEIYIDEIYKVNDWNRSTPIIIDCGSNIGLSSIYFAKYQNAKVFAFEADPNIFEVLKQNIETNKLTSQIEVMNKAVWTNEEGVRFDIEGGYSGQIHQHGHELVKNSIQIPSLRLRNLLEKFETVDFLKLDIEGAENFVVPDCEGLLSKVHYIFLEYHSVAKDDQLLGELLEILKNEGFRYHIKEAFTSNLPFLRIKEKCGMDLQLNIFAINKNFKISQDNSIK